MNCSSEIEPRPNVTSRGPELRILIADGSELYREMLRLVLEALPRLKVLATVGDGCQALQMVAALRPDLLLIDLDLPGINGLHSAALTRQCHPATRVIIIAPDDSEELRETCLSQGADGFLSKRRLATDLKREIGHVFSSVGS